MSTCQPTDILIVEDNQADAFYLTQCIEKIGYPPPLVAVNTETAQDIIVHKQPPVIICDLLFDNEPRGLDLLRRFSNQSAKFIIVTNSIERPHYTETKTIGVGGYLIKPFHFLSLQSAIDQVLALPVDGTPAKASYLFIRATKNKQTRIDFADILYMYSERNYMFVKTVDKLYALKRSLTKMQQELDERFIRIHNSYIINADYLKSVAPSTALVYKDILPVGRAYRKGLTNKLKLTVSSEVW